MLISPSVWLLKCGIGSAFFSVSPASNRLNKVIQKHVTFSRCLSSKTDAEFGITNIQDDDDFKKRVLENPAPVLVDFHAKWCGPCKILGPRLENVMKSYMKSILLAKVDVDQLETVSGQYQISVVPTVISMRNGKEIERFEGAKEEEFIKRKIESLLAHKA
ncbi:unnamed protein product [Heterobilharzia americana]|nr:unnamed protein product [Heterobilharzia americana]CAH8526470.1 unnamed protein product [Heterobilharzia americana]